MHTPGIVNLPVLFTSLLAISAKAPRTLPHSAFFSSHAVANWSAISLFEMDLADFAARVAFMAFMVFMGAIAGDLRESDLDETEQKT